MKKKLSAFSILEVVVALALITMIFLLVGSWSGFNLAKLSSQQGNIEAQFLVAETPSILATIAKRDWSLFKTEVGSLMFDNNVWSFLGSGTVEQIGSYQRRLQLASVCRNSSQSVVDCNLGTPDPGTFKYTVTVTWSDWSGNHQIQKDSYIANWR